MNDIARERERYERQIRLASEGAAIGIAGILLLSAALPTVNQTERIGIVTTSVCLLLFALLWFHVIPERVFGPRRFLAGAIIVQVIAWFLLLVTDGIDSRYFVFFLVPVLASAFALRLNATLIVGGLAIGSFVMLAFLDPEYSLRVAERDIGIVRFFGLIAITLVTALITRTMEQTRTTLRRSTAELTEHNRELEASRSIALRLSRLRERDEIIRAVHEAAQRAIEADRAFVFLDPGSNFADGWTIGPSGLIERFMVDESLPEAVRLRAAREMRTIVIGDASREPGILPRSREHYGLGSAVIVPLVHRGQVIAVAGFTSPKPREWTPLDVRLAETIAEGSAPAVATFLTLDELREERERLARRTRVLEGLANLSESLALSMDDAIVATSAARNLHHTFDLRAATVLFSDPSLALLEPRATTGDASPHPVVTGPQSCPAIRSGRLFRVESADSPVVCPHVEYRAGTRGFVCLPFVAAGQNVGAMFLEPDGSSVMDEALLRGAADRIALTVANQRVLETAQRQAVTDGLTGLFNRHFMAEQLRLLHSLATRHGRAYSAIAVDVDRLKTINDTFGHEKGDLALRGLANALRRTLRASDVPVKTGGDEFVILLPDTNLAEAGRVAQRVKAAVDEQGRIEPDAAITISLGVASWRAGRDAKDVLEAADAALYEAKRAGRDRVSVESEASPA